MSLTEDEEVEKREVVESLVGEEDGGLPLEAWEEDCSASESLLALQLVLWTEAQRAFVVR